MVYPNPANNELNIIGKDEINRVEIFDLLGKSLLIQNKAISKIDIQFLTPGFYLIQVNSSSKQQQIKFIKS